MRSLPLWHKTPCKKHDLVQSGKNSLTSFMFNKSKDTTLIKAKRTEGANTRSQSKVLFKVKKPNTEKYKASLSYRGPKKWNNLPESIQKSENKYVFKTKLKTELRRRAAQVKSLKETGNTELSGSS